MDINIESKNITVSDDLDKYTRRQVDKLLRYLPHISEISIDLSHENTRRGGDLVGAQITLRHERGAILRAEEKTNGDIEKAIDGAVDKMYRRIQRFKGKRQRKGRERYVATLQELDMAEDIPDLEVYEEAYVDLAAEYEAMPDGDSEFVPIARRKDVELNPMSEIEAIEQMELLGHSFFMFFNGDTQVINVIYRRQSGDYGILVPVTP
jgi:putative sigma-54 modulation protein